MPQMEAVLLQALSLVLLDHEELNSSLGEDGASTLVHRRHNIGVAMATPTGLVVSNIWPLTTDH